MLQRLGYTLEDAVHSRAGRILIFGVVGLLIAGLVVALAADQGRDRLATKRLLTETAAAVKTYRAQNGTLPQTAQTAMSKSYGMEVPPNLRPYADDIVLLKRPDGTWAVASRRFRYILSGE